MSTPRAVRGKEVAGSELPATTEVNDRKYALGPRSAGDESRKRPKPSAKRHQLESHGAVLS
jgi:hypothetical protein